MSIIYLTQFLIFYKQELFMKNEPESTLTLANPQANPKIATTSEKIDRRVRKTRAVLEAAQESSKPG